jgi:ankyrin repeat protein
MSTQPINRLSHSAPEQLKSPQRNRNNYHALATKYYQLATCAQLVDEEDKENVGLLVQESSNAIHSLLRNLGIQQSKLKQTDELFAGIYSSDLKKVTWLKKNGADLNLCSLAGRLPLHEALRQKKKKISSFLLDNGADPSIQDGKGKTALFYLAQPTVTKSICLFKKMLERAKIEPAGMLAIRDNKSKSALHAAVKMQSSPEWISYLIDQGADPNAVCMNGNSSLHVAIRERVSTAVIDVLLDKKAAIELKNYHNVTPLGIALAQGDFPLASFLIIEKGAPIDSDALEKAYALSWIDAPLACLLIEQGDFSQTKINQLAFACKFNLSDKVAQLLEWQLPTTSLLQTELFNKHLLNCFYLLEKGANPNHDYLADAFSSDLVDIYKTTSSIEVRHQKINDLIDSHLKKGSTEYETDCYAIRSALKTQIV